ISERENPDANVNPYAQTYIEMDNAPACQIEPGAPAGSVLLLPPLILVAVRRRAWPRCTLPLLALLLLVARPAAGQLVGDCNQDGCVRVNELILCVDVALGRTDVTTCSSCSGCFVHGIQVDCLTTAVANALGNCQSSSTAAAGYQPPA